MADEQAKPQFSRPAIVPEGLDWPSLLERDGDELEVHYRHVLTELGRKPGMLGVVFRKAQQNPLRLEHLQEFITLYSADDRTGRTKSERFHRFSYEELLARDKASLDITWLRDDSLEDTENLPPPEVIAQEIVEDLEAALVEFASVAASLASLREPEPEEIPRDP